MPCRINVFSGRQRERSPRENPPNNDFFVFSHGDLSPRQAKIQQTGAKTKRSPRKNPPNDDFFVFSHGDFLPRHTKVRDNPCVAFSATVCRIFAWRGERSPCENPAKSPFCGFSRGNLSRFRPENTFIRHGINQPPQCTDKRMHTMFVGPKLVQLPSHLTLLTKAIPLVNDQHSN